MSTDAGGVSALNDGLGAWRRSEETMDYYTPTMNLRFVEREEESFVDANGMILPRGTMRVVKRRVLQQLWLLALQGEDNEWRDVPMVYE